MPVNSEKIDTGNERDDAEIEIEVSSPNSSQNSDKGDGIKLPGQINIDDLDASENSMKKKNAKDTENVMDELELIKDVKNEPQTMKERKISKNREKAGASAMSKVASQKTNKRKGSQSPPLKRPNSITKSNRNAGNASPAPLSRRK